MRAETETGHATFVEYTVLFCLIAVAAIAAAVLLQDGLQTTFISSI